jgi:hypothetical protein
MRRTISLSSALVLTAALTACSASSAKSDQSAASTSTTAPRPATAPSSEAIAAKAALQLADVGSGFASYRKGAGTTPVGAKSCSVIVPGAVLTARDHYYAGPMFEKTDSKYFAYSETYVFREEATARQYAAFRATPAFKQCKQRQDDAATRAAQAGSYVRLSSDAFTDPSGHIVTMYREYTGTTSGGRRVDGGFYDRYTLRRGPVVVVVDIDSELGKDDAASNAIAQQTGTILQSFDRALSTRLGNS